MHKLAMIGIIGGSGFYHFLETPEPKIIETKYGTVTLEMGYIKDKEVFFLPRHGLHHTIMPSTINYEANMAAISQLNPSFVLTSNAVGSLDPELKPGTFTVPTDIIDRTYNRLSNQDHFNNIKSVDYFNPKVRKHITKALERLDFNYHSNLTLVVTQGPRFETPAEIKAYRIMGADLVGMTSMPEAFLATYYDIPYASLALVSNLAAGLQSEVTEKEVFDLFRERIGDIKSIFRSIIMS